MLAVVICERLAALGRAGYPVRAALVELADRIPDRSPGVVAVGRRARLGAPLATCLEPLRADFGDSFVQLCAAIEPSAETGADWVAALGQLRDSITTRAALRRSAEVAGAGATLSARLIAALPLLMLPVSLRQITDGVVAVSICLGLTLGVVGYRWLLRVIPHPPEEDPNEAVAEEVASSLDAGCSLDAALHRALAARGALAPVLRRARLGLPWRSALSGHLPGVADALADAERTGAPIAQALRATAVTVRMEKRHRFERHVQRAPVKMVVLLVTCCLPAFVLIAIVPLLRGLSQPV